ncbi:MAG: phosphoribosylanthranilate isomerase [Ruminococcus sp.]|nr:phosphoribosylanthranilate isomerase [Ruminococcus sp.]
MKIKICGIKNEADAKAVNACKPDYCGFIFAPSKRRISIQEAEKLRRLIDDNIKAVGVFTDTSPIDIAKLYGQGIIQLAQLHGGQNNGFLTELKLLCNIPIIQAIRDKSEDMPHKNADFLLYDGAKAGSGIAFDWNTIPDTSKPFFLAGGINITNIDEAKRQNPYCIDIASGAEDDRGNKDTEKMKILIDRVRSV